MNSRESNWQAARLSERERERTISLFDEATSTNGIVRWNSNGRVPPQDILDTWASAGLDFDSSASTAAREAETEAFLVEYCRAQASRRPSAEEMSEMRAAFGPGAEVVNVFTGRTVRT